MNTAKVYVNFIITIEIVDITQGKWVQHGNLCISKHTIQGMNYTSCSRIVTF